MTEHVDRLPALLAQHAAPFEALRNLVREIQRRTDAPLAALQRAVAGARASMTGRP